MLPEAAWQQRWVIGNWKMHHRQAQHTAWIHRIDRIQRTDTVVGLAVSAPYLSQWQGVGGILVGAQDVSVFAEDGAHTGETSAAMLADVGARFCLIGHSERRIQYGEDHTVIATKLRHGIRAGLLPVLCIGESWAQREAAQQREVIRQQLEVVWDCQAEELVIAYEPVWAIGTGRHASVEDIGAMHAWIHELVLSSPIAHARLRMLYGGSVNRDNIAGILAVPHVDGVLVGGASLSMDTFSAIITAC